jgi:diaminopropionate ammonia-lyase
MDAAQKAVTPKDLLLSDTAWAGYEQIPSRIVEGYATLFFETEDEVKAAREGPVDLVLVQIGAGALAAATLRHYRRPGLRCPPRIVGVEPDSAACGLASVGAGHIVSLPGPFTSIMAGLNCGRLSTLAFPLLRDGIEAFVTIDDQRCIEAMRVLARAGIVSGETGAAGFAGLLELLRGPSLPLARERLGLSARSRVLVIVTEGATDPDAWRGYVRSSR